MTRSEFNEMTEKQVAKSKDVYLHTKLTDFTQINNLARMILPAQGSSVQYAFNELYRRSGVPISMILPYNG